jgi:hypothetical protein
MRTPMFAQMQNCVRVDAPCPRGRTMSARTCLRPRGRECFIPGNFKKDATVHLSHGRPRSLRPTVRPKSSA